MTDRPLLKKSKTFFIADPSPSEEPQKTFKKSATIAMDVENVESEPFSPESPRKKLKRALTVRSTTFVSHQTFLKKQVIIVVIIALLLILERLFIDNLHPKENIAIEAIQRGFGETYSSSKWYLVPIVFLENSFNFYVVMTHFFLFIYYYISPVMGLKIMHVSLNLSVIVCILEIVYGASRPFWETLDIASVNCESSYAFPSINIFAYTFLFLYTNYCLNESDEENKTWTPKKIAIFTIAIIILIIFCLFRVVAGISYISQTLFTLFYAMVFFYIATFYNKSLTSIVEKSSMDVQAAKSYTIYWFLYLMVAGTLSVFFYEGANPLLPIDFVSNFTQCMLNLGTPDKIIARSPYHLIGPWESFLKTIVVVMLMGMIFGTAKTFRDFEGVTWYAVDTKKKLKMTIIANLCLIPSWVFLALQYWVITDFMDLWLNMYLLNLLHFFVVFFVIFGVLPRYVFMKLDLVKTNSESFLSSGYLEKNQSVL